MLDLDVKNKNVKADVVGVKKVAISEKPKIAEKAKKLINICDFYNNYNQLLYYSCNQCRLKDICKNPCFDENKQCKVINVLKTNLQYEIKILVDGTHYTYFYLDMREGKAAWIKFQNTTKLIFREYGKPRKHKVQR